MSAAIFDIRSGRVIPCAGGELDESPELQINRRVLAQLRGKVRGETIAMAQRRAQRIIREEPGTTVGQAIARGIAWAVSEEDSNPPPVAA